MARGISSPGGQASAIQFRALNGSPAQSSVLQGTVNYRPPQIVNEPIDDAHTPLPQYRKKFMYGEIRMTALLPPDASWLRGDVIADAELEVVFTNGLTITFSGVTLSGDAVEQDLTAGQTNELKFTFVSSTES